MRWLLRRTVTDPIFASTFTLHPDRGADATAAALPRAGSGAGFGLGSELSSCHHQASQAPPDLSTYAVFTDVQIASKAWTIDADTHPCSSKPHDRDTTRWLSCAWQQVG